MLSQHVLEVLKPLEKMPFAEPAVETADANSSWEARISAEAAAGYTRSDADRAPYSGQYVAVLDGQVVDHDVDQRALAIRIHRQYPKTPVLIAEAEARQPREFLILSPRLERMEIADA